MHQARRVGLGIFPVVYQQGGVALLQQVSAVMNVGELHGYNCVNFLGGHGKSKNEIH
jgi:hypothetical protein